MTARVAHSVMGLRTGASTYKDIFIWWEPAQTGLSHDKRRQTRFRCPQFGAQGDGRGDTPARYSAAGRGRAHRVRSHRHPSTVAAAYFAPPEASRRGRPGRTLPRGDL